MLITEEELNKLKTWTLKRSDFLKGGEYEDSFDEIAAICKKTNDEEKLTDQWFISFSGDMETGHYLCVHKEYPTEKQIRTEELKTLISEQKRYLNESDYIVTKLNEISVTGTEEEIAEMKEKYKEDLEKRKDARKIINEAEKELENL